MSIKIKLLTIRYFHIVEVANTKPNTRCRNKYFRVNFRRTELRTSDIIITFFTVNDNFHHLTNLFSLHISTDFLLYCH